MKIYLSLITLLLVLILGFAFLGQWYADKKRNEVLTLETQTFDLGDGVKLEMVHLPAGTFRMGSADNWLSFLPWIEEFEYKENETPAHTVELSEFWIGKYEVTQEQYEAVMGNNPSYYQESKNPVEKVSWDDAMRFCKNLSIQTGTSFTLPTEAQWEYACRAGSTTAFYFGNDESKLGDYAWYGMNKSGGTQTHPVGQKMPNDWGLYDMCGNVWEWCRDPYGKKFYGTSAAIRKNPENMKTPDFQVQRGGSWGLISEYSRSASRLAGPPDAREYDGGFRIVRIQP